MDELIKNIHNNSIILSMDELIKNMDELIKNIHYSIQSFTIQSFWMNWSKTYITIQSFFQCMDWSKTYITIQSFFQWMDWSKTWMIIDQKHTYIHNSIISISMHGWSLIKNIHYNSIILSMHGLIKNMDDHWSKTYITIQSIQSFQFQWMDWSKTWMNWSKTYITIQSFQFHWMNWSKTYITIHNSIISISMDGLIKNMDGLIDQKHTLQFNHSFTGWIDQKHT